jgi:hypothetical protein
MVLAASQMTTMVSPWLIQPPLRAASGVKRRISASSLFAAANAPSIWIAARTFYEAVDFYDIAPN